MINTTMSRKLVFTKNYAVENLDSHEKNLFCFLNETWYDHSELFNESFINQLVKLVSSDVHISSNYSLSTEDRVLLNIELADIKQNTQTKKDIIRFITNNIDTYKPSDTISAWNVLSMFVNILNYECHTLVIFGHPEPNFSNSLDILTSDESESLLVKGFRDFIKYFPSEYDSDYTAELNSEDFSFTELHNLGITFGYEIPIYTRYSHLKKHKEYWSDFMMLFYSKLLTIYDTVPIISVGCSDEFNDMLKKNSKKDVVIFPSIFTINRFANGLNDAVYINQSIAAKVGELLAAILYELDLDMDERNKILTYV